MSTSSVSESLDGAKVPYHSWFKHITGLSEPEFRRPEVLKSRFQLNKDDGKTLEIVNSARSKVIKCGVYSEHTIDELRSMLPKPTNVSTSNSSTHEGKQSTIPFEIYSSDEYSRANVDVAKLQADASNNGAVFQVASNFNGVEAISEDSFPDQSTFLEDYVYDRTQGPRASISAGGAAIARVLAAFYDASKDPTSWQQSRKRQLDYLSNVSKYYTNSNGYVVNTGQEDPFPEVGTKEYDTVVSKIKVGVHRGCQVTTGGTVPAPIQDRREYVDASVPETQIIDQVFCAAMNVSQGGSGYKNGRLPGAKNRMQACLDAAYTGTYLASATAQRKAVFLTAIGGGVFGNPFSNIVQAIAKAHKEVAVTGNSIERAVLVLYNQDPIPIKSALEQLGLEVKITKFTKQY